jgi:hypothetical protein
MIKLTQEEAREKKHNPWYCMECRKLVYISYGYYYDVKTGEDFEVPHCPVCNICNVAEKPQRETPEEFKDRTGRPWADGSAVYMKVGKNDWRMVSYREAKFTAECCEGEISCLIYCANSDAGIPENTRRRKRRKRNGENIQHSIFNGGG